MDNQESSADLHSSQSILDLQPIIDSISCPITKDIMQDPVQGLDGHTYERSAIVHWLQVHGKSPMSNIPMTENDLKFSASIKYLADKYLAGSFGKIEIADEKPVVVSPNNIKLKSSSNFNSNGTKFMIKMEIDEETIPEEFIKKTLPQEVVVIMDRSGSMGASVEAKDADGKNMEDGLNQMDLCTYAARTMAATLSPRDRMGIISFDDKVEINHELTEMTEINFNLIASTLSDIKPRACTNIWGAVEQGLGMIHDRRDKSRNAHLVILTDGVPNYGRPARGEIGTLIQRRKDLNFSSSINTIGFGYDLEEGLLYGMSKVANGVMGHMPDGGMVATVFNHLTGNILCSVAMNLQITVFLDFPADFEDIPVMGDFHYIKSVNREKERTEIKIDVGTVQRQQSRNIILNILNPENENWRNKISYSYSYKIGGVIGMQSDVLVDEEVIGEKEMEAQIWRNYMVEKIREAVQSKNKEINGGFVRKPSLDIYNEIVDYFDRKQLTDALSIGLYNTLTDQVKMALSILPEHKTYFRGREMPYFKKWGHCYLDQLCSHINFEKRGNFKDEAFQTFGGDLMIELVDYGSDKFDTLTPPDPFKCAYSSEIRNSGAFSTIERKYI